jgi:hypothetical protein
MSTRFARRGKSSLLPTERSTVAKKDNEKKDMKRKRIVRVDPSSALYNFLYNIKTLNAGCCRLADVGIYKYTIKSSRWIVGTNRPEELIVVETEDGNRLVVHYNDLRLNGKSIDKICIPGRCYTSDDIRRMVVTAISKLAYPNY